MITREIVFLSSVSIIIGLILWRAGSRMLTKGKKAVATIIKFSYRPTEVTRIVHKYGLADDSASYFPVIRFRTDKNELITKELDTGHPEPRLLGKTLTVLYDPNDPEDIVTYPKIQLEIIPKALIGVGVTGLLVVIFDAYEIVSIIPDY